MSDHYAYRRARELGRIFSTAIEIQMRMREAQHRVDSIFQSMNRSPFYGLCGVPRWRTVRHWRGKKMVFHSYL